MNTQIIISFLKRCFSFIKSELTDKSFYLGALVTVGVFSHYIFGANNLAEELAEKLLHQTINIDIDFTPDVPEDSEVSERDIAEFLQSLKNTEVH